MARIAGVTREQSESKILGAALYCLANLGDKATTFQTIADHAGVSGALVVRYFKTREEIYPRVLDHVIEAARANTVQGVSEATDPLGKMRAYFKVSIAFFRETPERAKIYLLLYHFASFDPKYKDICTEIKEVALKRIEKILEAGELSGQFRIGNRALTARMIHNSLNGLLISILTNHQPCPDSVLIQQFEKLILPSICVPDLKV